MKFSFVVKGNEQIVLRLCFFKSLVRDRLQNYFTSQRGAIIYVCKTIIHLEKIIISRVIEKENDK